jgi:hypothetical protein
MNSSFAQTQKDTLEKTIDNTFQTSSFFWGIFYVSAPPGRQKKTYPDTKSVPVPKSKKTVSVRFSASIVSDCKLLVCFHPLGWHKDKQ